jgi:hypothetical protein
VFLTPAQVERLIVAVVNDDQGADVGDHELYVYLANAYDRISGA